MKDIGGSGYRIYPQPSFTNNTKINCLFNKLLANGSNVVCNTVIPYKEDAWREDVDLYTQPFYEVDSRKAITSYDDNGKLYNSFNSNNTNTDCNIYIHKTMIHEFIHADIKAWTKYNNFNFAGDPIAKKYWDEGGDWEHEYMAGEYFDQIIEFLKDLYGDQYTQREDEAIVWSGLHKTKAFENSILL